jgi:hypothetical protein
MPDDGTEPQRFRFGSRNIALLSVALVSLAVGYVLLSKGDTTIAPILLVVGYCVLFPLGLAL